MLAVENLADMLGHVRPALQQLRERVGAVGGTVETVQDEDRFTLTAHFPSRTKESR